MSWKRPESPGSFTLMFYLLVKEAANIGVLLKKVFLKIHKTHRKIPVSASNKRLRHKYFHVNFSKFLRSSFLQDTPPGECFWSNFANVILP